MRIIYPIFISLFALTLICTAGYHWLMFGLEIRSEHLIEDFNYSVQTITTIGYGNWVPTDWNLTDAEKRMRILNVKALSILFMLVGGSLFVVLLGIVSTFLSQRRR